MREKFLSKKNVKGSLGFFSSAGKAELVGQLEKKRQMFSFYMEREANFPSQLCHFLRHENLKYAIFSESNELFHLTGFEVNDSNELQRIGFHWITGSPTTNQIKKGCASFFLNFFSEWIPTWSRFYRIQPRRRASNKQRFFNATRRVVMRRPIAASLETKQKWTRATRRFFFFFLSLCWGASIVAIRVQVWQVLLSLPRQQVDRWKAEKGFETTFVLFRIIRGIGTESGTYDRQ